MKKKSLSISQMILVCQRFTASVSLHSYTEWRNFTEVIHKAKTACEIAGHAISDHFVDVNKMVAIGSRTEREINDLMLTHFACYFEIYKR